MNTIQDRFEAVENTLNGVIFERPKEIKAAIVALVAGKHFLMVGPPGTAKSKLTDTLVKLIDVEGHYFKYLMTRFTTPEEIFGPPSLKALKNDEYRRVTTRRLPESRVAFLDECFKANSSILNSLLTILNEGVFYNGPDMIETELNTLFGASNELPKEAELAALWDRITFRFEVSPLRAAESRRKMLQSRIAAIAENFAPLVSWDDLQQAQAEASKVVVPDEIIEKILELQDALKKEGVEPTDRRFSDSMPILQAVAWRNRRNEVEAEDMRILTNVLWVDIKDQPIVSRKVLDIANPLDREALDLLEAVEKLALEADQILKNQENKNKQRQQGVEVHGKLEKANAELQELAKKAPKGKKSDLIEEAQQRIAVVAELLLEQLFGLKGDH